MEQPLEHQRLFRSLVAPGSCAATWVWALWRWETRILISRRSTAWRNNLLQRMGYRFPASWTTQNSDSLLSLSSGTVAWQCWASSSVWEPSSSPARGFFPRLVWGEELPGARSLGPRRQSRISPIGSVRILHRCAWGWSQHRRPVSLVVCWHTDQLFLSCRVPSGRFPRLSLLHVQEVFFWHWAPCSNITSP